MGSLNQNCIGVEHSGELVTFNSKRIEPLKSLKVYFSPVQEGEGDPSPENVRAIIGWDGITIKRTGNNLWSPTLEPEVEGTYLGWKMPPVEKIRFKTFTTDNSSTQRTSVGLTPNGKNATEGVNWFWTNITPYNKNIIRDNLGYLVVYPKINGIRELINQGNCLVTISDVDIDYEPYNGQTIPITFPASAGTLYGGYVDLVNGDLVATCGYVSLDNTNAWTMYVEGKFYVPDVTNDAAKQSTGYISNQYLFSGNGNTTSAHVQTDKRFYGQYTYNRIWVYDSQYTTLEAFKAALAEHPLQVVYPINTPIHYQLTPQQIQTLIGTNNIWSNADSVTAETFYIEPVQQTYKKFFYNEPHIVSASGDLITFDTDMKAPLKECKIGFSPIQLGEGDPSPENVREIQGWDGITCFRTGKNLLDPSLTITTQGLSNSYAIVNADSSITVYQRDGTSWFKRGYIDLPKGTYDFYSVFENNYYSRYIINEDNTAEIPFSGKKTVTITETTRFRFKLAMGTDYPVTGWLQIFKSGDTYTEEPFISNQYTVNWSNEHGTIYGGYIDLVNGTLVQEWNMVVADSSDAPLVNYGSDSYQGTEGTNRGFLLPQDKSFDAVSPSAAFGKVFSDKVNLVYTGIWSKPNNNIWNSCLYNKTQWHIVFDNDVVGITSDMDWAQRGAAIKAWVKENPITLVYKLETPIVHQLTPQILKTLKGTNNIWSSANGDLEIKYYKH